MPNYRRVFEDGYSYFLTVITYQRNPILIDNIELLRESFRQSKQKYRYSIEAIVILPEHFHMMITPENATDYPRIVGAIKAYFSRYCDIEALEQSQSRNKKRYKPVWQKRYFEHTIRNEKDFELHLNYIKQNPVKHGLVESALEWEYSSFFER